MKTDEQFLNELSAYQRRLQITDKKFCELIPIARHRFNAIRDGLLPADIDFRERALAALLAYEKRMTIVDQTLMAAQKGDHAGLLGLPNERARAE